MFRMETMYTQAIIRCCFWANYLPASFMRASLALLKNRKMVMKFMNMYMSITALRLLKAMSAIWNPSEYTSHLLSFFFRNLLSTFCRVFNASKITDSTRAEQYMNFCFLAKYRSFLTLC